MGPGKLLLVPKAIWRACVLVSGVSVLTRIGWNIGYIADCRVDYFGRPPHRLHRHHLVDLILRQSIWVILSDMYLIRHLTISPSHIENRPQALLARRRRFVVWIEIVSINSNNVVKYGPGRCGFLSVKVPLGHSPKIIWSTFFYTKAIIYLAHFIYFNISMEVGNKNNGHYS